MAAALAKDGLHLSLEGIEPGQRHKGLHGACEAAAVDADCALAMQEVLGGSDGHGHLLMLLIPGGDDVLQVLPAAQTGLGDQRKEGLEVVRAEGVHLLCDPVVVGVDVESAQNGAVAALSAALRQFGKEGLKRYIAQNFAAADRCHGAAVGRDGGILVSQIGVVCTGIQDAEREAGLGKIDLHRLDHGVLPTLEAIWSIRPQGLPK